MYIENLSQKQSGKKGKKKGAKNMQLLISEDYMDSEMAKKKELDQINADIAKKEKE